MVERASPRAVDRALIAGAGIGGLSAAACLLKAGIDVEVFEQAPELGEIGAGIQISANAARVYSHLGILDDIVDVGVAPDAYVFRLFDSGEVLQTIPLGAGYAQKHGVPYVTIHRADLHKLLVDAVNRLKPGAIHLNAAATGFTEDGDGVTLHFRQRMDARGEVLIGADGIKSAIRDQIVGQEPPNYTGNAAWRVTVPAADVAPEFRSNQVEIWVGPRCHAARYPLRGGELINFVACVEHDTWRDESWVAPAPWEELRDDFAHWHPALQAIVAVADRDRCYRWAMNDRRPIGNWSTRRTTLLGDAAHPTLPNLAQGAAMAVEDSVVIARALSRDLPVADALDLYQRNRTERTARVVEESSANRVLFHKVTVGELKAAFAARNMDAERNQWIFSYDPVTVELT